MQLKNFYVQEESGYITTEKVVIKGDEAELRTLALTILDAIDKGKSRGEIDGVPLKVKLIH